jgi:hypothetical protein
MPLNFPSSPTNGQIYENYYYDSANTVWQTLGSKLETTANISNTPTGTYTSGGVSYKYVSFTSSGTLTVTRAGFCDVLVVGGGGGGGISGTNNLGGGGGGGGGCIAQSVYLPFGSHSVTVGSGGSGYSLTNAGRNGQSSALGYYVAPGGGLGGNNFGTGTATDVQRAGNAGGSGGGGSATNGLAGSGISPAGNNGGTGTVTAGGGGGGSQEVGNADGDGYGGDGIESSITGSVAYYGGGGNGGGQTAATTGGGGVGGADGGNNPGGNATANTGGGGGGGWRESSGDVAGGNGATGIVIVRWVA